MRNNFLARFKKIGNNQKKLIATNLGKILQGSALFGINEGPSNPVFIIGCGRSGTSLLESLLSKHPKICDFSEANEVWDPKGYPWLDKLPESPPIWLDPIGYKRGWEERFSGKQEKELKAVFRVFQLLSAGSLFLNKSPMNTFRIGKILDIFPSARLIHIYRDGRAVTFSWAKKQYSKNNSKKGILKKRGMDYSFDEILEIVSKSWKVHIAEIEEKKREHDLENDERFYELSYESLCRAPRSELEELINFLGIPMGKLKALDLNFVENRNFKWQKELKKGQIKKMESVMKPALGELGYG